MQLPVVTLFFGSFAAPPFSHFSLGSHCCLYCGVAWGRYDVWFGTIEPHLPNLPLGGGQTHPLFARAPRLPALPRGNTEYDEPSLMLRAFYMRASVGWATGRAHHGGRWRRAASDCVRVLFHENDPHRNRNGAASQWQVYQRCVPSPRRAFRFSTSQFRFYNQTRKPPRTCKCVKYHAKVSCRPRRRPSPPLAPEMGPDRSSRQRASQPTPAGKSTPLGWPAGPGAACMHMHTPQCTDTCETSGDWSLGTLEARDGEAVS